MRRALLLVGPILLLATAVPAQPPPAAGAPAAADADAALVEQAIGLLTSGDAAGAVSLLEPVRERPAPPPRLLALLGTAYLEAGRAADALQVLTPLASGEHPDPAVLFNAGRAALATGQVAAGERFLERSVALQTGTPAARELGLLRGTQGRMHDSYRLLRPWVLANPEDREARLAAALAAIQLDRLSEAEALLDDLPPEADRVRLLWGKIRLLRDDPQGAVATLAPILESGGSAVELEARRVTAEAQVALDKPEEAVALLEGRTAGDPAASLALGQAQFRAGRADDAIATLQPFAEHLLQVDPSSQVQMGNRDLAARYGLAYGRFLAAEARHEEALPNLVLATRLQPNNQYAWKLLANTLTALGRNAEAGVARKHFDDLAGDDDGEADLANVEDPTERAVLRARALLSAGRYDEALATLRSEIELAPQDPRPRLLESRALLLAGRPEEALAKAEDIVAHFPDHPDAYYQRGTVHLAMEHRESAEADFREALRLAPDHVPAMSDLAVLLTIRGERVEAERLLERVLELRPDDPRAKENLERIRAGKGG